MKKLTAQPVSVSQCNPVYKDKKIKSWTVAVEYQGDLRLPGQKQLPRGFDAGVELNPIYSIRNERDVMRINYNINTGNTRLTYVFDDGLFGHGSERAWQLRLWAMARINENTK